MLAVDRGGRIAPVNHGLEKQAHTVKNYLQDGMAYLLQTQYSFRHAISHRETTGILQTPKLFLMNDISSARMAVARQRPQSTDPTLTVRSYDAKLGTNVHNYWKKSQKKPPAESHAPVALDQGIFNQPGPACDMPSFEQGDISLKPNLSLTKAFPYF